MKISSVSVTIVPTADGEEPVTAGYSTINGAWKLEGIIHARHLKVLTGITDLCREADIGLKPVVHKGLLEKPDGVTKDS